MILTGLFLILGVKEYLFRLYALLPAGLPAGRLRSNLSVWQAQRGSCSFGRLRGIMEQPPQAADPQPGENSLVFNEREHFPWRRATWLRH
jgi:hypothetical protein